MAANIGHSLYFALFLEFFSLLLLGFLGKAFGCSFKFVLVHNEKVARSTLREIWLRQDVLHSRDWTDFTLIVDVLELVHVIWLIDDPVSLLEMNQFVVWISWCFLSRGLLQLGRCRSRLVVIGCSGCSG